MDKLEYLEHRRAIRRAYKEGGMATKEEMDQAAVTAASEFSKKLADLDTEAGPGAFMVLNWLAQHYRTAGYKRLCRHLIFEVLPRMESGEL